jgi:3-phenylpropionate/trans-cinnamate dioxygenase ferredoxin reductase component
MTDPFVIIGAGQAAAAAVETLRREHFNGRTVVIGEEPQCPYQRPPLSKEFLAGEIPPERLLLKPSSFYEKAGAELRLGVRAEELNLKRREVRLSSGERLTYDRLLLATGSAPRRLTVDGAGLADVYYLRTVEDVIRIQTQLLLERNKRVVVVGAGYIGLEVAATCRQLGHEVDVLEMTDRVMNRVVAPEVSSFFAAEHERAGVRIHTERLVSHFEPRSDDASCVGCVATLDGHAFPADLVIVGVGAVPVTELSVTAGLAVENGIAVDEYCRTSDEHVWAAGDCTNHPSPRYHRRVRLESVDNAFEQAKSAAANMVGKAVVHDKIPWFWSDQFDLKLMIVGLNFDYDQALLRGDPATRAFCCCYLRNGELLAIDCVNNPRDYMAAKRLIAERTVFDPDRLADASVPLKDAAVAV